MHCEHFMHQPVVTATESDTIAYAAKVMRESRVGLVPIVDDAGRFAGMVAERDIITALGAGAATDTKLSRVARPPVACALRDSLELAEKKMVDAASHYVVVCDDRDTPRGVIGISDLARHEDPRRVATVLRHLVYREARS